MSRRFSSSLPAIGGDRGLCKVARGEGSPTPLPRITTGHGIRDFSGIENHDTGTSGTWLSRLGSSRRLPIFLSRVGTCLARYMYGTSSKTLRLGEFKSGQIRHCVTCSNLGSPGEF